MADLPTFPFINASYKHILTALRWARDFWRRKYRENPTDANRKSYLKASQNVLHWQATGRFPDMEVKKNDERTPD